jgi:hypothetical protein
MLVWGSLRAARLSVNPSKGVGAQTMAQHNSAFKHHIAAKYQLVKKMIERAKALGRKAHPLTYPPPTNPAPVWPSFMREDSNGAN